MHFYLILALVALTMLTSACSSLRFVPEGETMLQKVRMTSDVHEVKPSEYRRFVRQEANSRWLSFLKVPLAFYRMSGTDSTRRFNRFLQRLGEAPVIYDPSLTDYTCQTIAQTLQGHGYLSARVTADTVNRNRRTSITYRMHPGGRSFVSQLDYSFDDERMRQLVMSPRVQKGSLIYRGMPFDTEILNEERKRIIRLLQNEGYYALNQDFITYAADTLKGDYGVEVTMEFRCLPGISPERAYVPYTFSNITINEEVSGRDDADSVRYSGMLFCSPQGRRRRVARRVLAGHVHLQPDCLYEDRKMQYTYQSLNSLGIVHYTSVRTIPYPDSLRADGTHPVDAEVFVKLNKPVGISFEVEGTNTAGDLGAAASLTLSHRNIFRGSELLSLKVRGAFESIRGLEGYADANFLEYGADLSLTVPRLMLPLRRKVAQRVRSNTEFSLQYNSQDRPEFHRRVWTGGLYYQWNPLKDTRFRHRVEAFSLNYLYMPWISATFRREYLDNTDSRNSILRYSYEDLFILKMGYGLTFNSLRQTGTQSLYNTDGYQIRFNTELAGSALYGLSALLRFRQNDEGEYVIGNIPFSQYAKVDFDFSKSVRLTDRSSLAFHGAVGVAIPFGNSTIIPYEKRYFSGGANSVRGWSVRELGPGAYTGRDGRVDFINQTGNLKLDLSVEYRAHLLWKIDGAAFIDAGNIWNTRHYEGMELGEFHWDSFARQIAVAYGLGLRLNFGYFIVRFDGGMKAVNPAYEGRRHYPLIHPNFKRDFTFHFAVGLPF